MMSIVTPFVKFAPNADIRKIHETFTTDLNLATFGLEYDELVPIFSGRKPEKEIFTQK